MQTDEKIQALTNLISLIEVLQARFEGRSSINHLKGALYTHRELLKGESVTASDIARLSGVSKSTISNCFSNISHVKLQSDQNDGRAKLVTLDDLEARTQYLVDAGMAWRD